MADMLGTGVEKIYPDTWTQATDAGSNYAAGIPQWSNQVYQNWYDQPLTTGITPNLQSTFQNFQTPNQQWIGGLQGAQQTAQGALPMYQQAANMFQSGSQYDPSQLQQYLNPYINDANNATIAQSNRNLNENILPGVNSTFAGAGQFGSTRNMDFTNRAMRDQQMVLAEALAKQNSANYTQANQDYLNWAKMGQSGASGIAGVGSNVAGLGNTLGGLAGTGSTLSQQNLTNQLTGATTEQQLQQQTLDKSYQDWLQQQQFPLGALSALGSSLGNMSKGVEPNTYTPVAQPNDIDKILTAIQAVQGGLNDSAVQGILSQLGMSNLFGSGSGS